ncbi:MAG: glycosyltransferase [Planctomycetia bacterium]|nr:glycosyltransferase [Planctomycetia bacterium]
MIYFAVKKQSGKLSYHSLLLNSNLRKLLDLSSFLQPAPDHQAFADNESEPTTRKSKALLIDSYYALSQNTLAADAWKLEYTCLDIISLGNYQEFTTALKSYIYTVCDAVGVDNLALSIHAGSSGSIPVIHVSNERLLQYWEPNHDCLTYESVNDLSNRVTNAGVELQKLASNAALKASSLAVEHEIAPCYNLSAFDGELSRSDQLRIRAWYCQSQETFSDNTLVKELQEYLSQSPFDPVMSNLFAITLLRSKIDTGIAESDWKEAIVTWKTLLAQNPSRIVASANLAQAYGFSGKPELALHQARHTLQLLGSSDPQLLADSLNSDCPFPYGYDEFRYYWERSAKEEALPSKIQLLTVRLHTLIARLTGNVASAYEAVHADPAFGQSKLMLAELLSRNGLHQDATKYLEQVVRLLPLHAEASRIYYRNLIITRQHQRALEWIKTRKRIANCSSSQHSNEAWLDASPPEFETLSSIIIPCFNELLYTRQCVESVILHTTGKYELILVDNGSTDGTHEYFQEIEQRLPNARVCIIRNEQNLGFPKACNQGLAQAKGQGIVFLNNDTVVTPNWLQGLWSAIYIDWPHVALAGPVSNYATDQQLVAGEYDDLNALPEFAMRRSREYRGKYLEVKRLTGFCLLARRDVLEEIGGFDERYGLGFFDDDDLCLRVNNAGKKAVLAQEVYIHHYGSRTMRQVTTDVTQLLRGNLEIFKDKWGKEAGAGYRFPQGAHGQAATPKRMRVSLTMIVKNEEQNLGRCLASVADLMDEIVIADTGSVDRTREIARQYGAKVVEFPWCDHFGAARNASLKEVTGDWCIWLDADDSLDQPNRKKMSELFAKLGQERDAYSLKVRSAMDAQHMNERVLDQVRIFPRHEEIRWEYRIHEQILPAVRRQGGNVRWADVVIDHHGYSNEVARKGKLERNLRLLEIDYAERPNDPYTLFNLGWSTLDMGDHEKALFYLRRSLDLSAPDSSVVRKLYSLISQVEKQQGRLEAALATCQRGLKQCPDDVELAFEEALLLKQNRDLQGATRAIERILALPQGKYFASIDPILREGKSRLLLAEIYRLQGRLQEAEAHLGAAIKVVPQLLPLWLELAEIGFLQKRWPLVEDAARGAEKHARNPLHSHLLRGRLELQLGKYQEAMNRLMPIAEKFPKLLAAQVLLSYAVLKAGNDMPLAERVLQRILELDPNNAEAKHNLIVLKKKTGDSAV